MTYFGKPLYQADPSELRIPQVERWKWTPVHGDLLNNLKSIQWEKPLWDTRVANKPFVFILAEPDIETGALLHTLLERAIPFLAIAAPLLSKIGLTWTTGAGSSTCVLKLGGKVIDPRLIHVCYWRWPQSADSSIDARVNESRWKTALAAWSINLNEKCLRLPAPLASLSSAMQNRFSDLGLAESIGLSVPKTLVSQDRTEIQKFFRFNKNGIIFREATPAQHLLAPQTLRIKKLKLTDLPKKDLPAPAAFQEIIESRTHLRAVVIGNGVTCAKLEILGHAKELDWRRVPVSSVDHAEFKLPAKVATGLIKFAKTNRMSVATFDLILAPKGQIYFLEMNRPGRWFYLELFAGLKIRVALADLIQKQLR